MEMSPRRTARREGLDGAAVDVGRRWEGIEAGARAHAFGLPSRPDNVLWALMSINRLASPIAYILSLQSPAVYPSTFADPYMTMSLTLDIPSFDRATRPARSLSSFYIASERSFKVTSQNTSPAQVPTTDLLEGDVSGGVGGSDTGSSVSDGLVPVTRCVR